MTRPSRIIARPAALLLVFLAVAMLPDAAAQSTLVERIQSALDEVARGLNTLGQRAGDIVGPGLRLDEEEPASFTETRSHSEHVQVGPAPSITISNEFGDIRVETWDNRVVEATAEIVVGAESAQVAREVAETIGINLTNAEETVEIRTILPSPRRDAGSLNISVNYRIMIPRNAKLLADNFFGDTFIRGVGGSTSVDSQYGALELRDLAGPVNVRAHGEFPLRASGLSAGGTFNLHGSVAEFSAVQGTLRVSNVRGSVRVSGIDQGALIDVSMNSGPVHVELAPGAQPDLHASVVYGAILSDIELARTAQGNRTVARAFNPDAPQRIALSAAFADVRITVAGMTPASQPAAGAAAKPFSDVVSRAEPVAPGVTLTVDATVGDVRVEEVPGDQVLIRGTRIVWTANAGQAPPAIDALALHVQRDQERVSINTVATGDLAAMGATAWRLDLLLQVPPGIQTIITAQQGATSLVGVTGNVQVVQATGVVTAERCAGPLNLSNQNGDITATGCMGGVEAAVKTGTLKIDRCGGKISAHTVQGRTIVDSPLGSLTVRTSDGDTRVLALEGINGDFDVSVENGNLSLLIPPQANASISATTHGGIVQSAHALSGNLTRDTQEFFGSLNDGVYRVRLEARNGDIILD